MSNPSRSEIRKSLRTTWDPDWKWFIPRVKLRARQALHAPALVTGADVKRPIFVLGAPRSGTTLLFRILQASSRVATWWPGEAHEVWEAEHHPALRGWTSNELGADDATPETVKRIVREFYLTVGGRKRLLDKTPRNSLRVQWVDAIFPDATYVFLKRDGRDTVNSLINAWRSPRYKTYQLPEPLSVPGVDGRWWKFVLYPGWEADRSAPVERIAAKQWSASIEGILAAREGIDDSRWTEISYEDLVDDPVSEAERLTKFLDLPFEQEVRSKAEGLKTTAYNTVTPPERGKWRRENPEEIRSILSVIEPAMTKLGYSMEETV
jgi:LPS sulfotransferase NodH